MWATCDTHDSSYWTLARHRLKCPHCDTTQAVRVAEEAERAEAALRNEASPLSDASLTHSLELGDANASELRSLLLELARRSNAGKTLAEIIRERRGVTASPTPVAIAAATTDDDSEGDAAAPADHAEARAPQEGPHWPDVAPEAVAEYHSAEGDAARAAVATARRDVEQLESEGRSLADDDRTDYGPGDVFFRLKGSCFETKQAQYTYSACPFGAAKQDSTSLGTFSGWGTKPAGPPAVAGALNATDYSVMKFTGACGSHDGRVTTSLRVTSGACSARALLHHSRAPHPRCRWQRMLERSLSVSHARRGVRRLGCVVVRRRA